MAITLTVDTTSDTVTVAIDFAGVGGTEIIADLYRGLSATGPWELIRADMDLLAERAYAYDNTAPLNTPVWYQARGYELADKSDTAAVLTAGPVTVVPGTGGWLRDPGRPWADIELDFCEIPQAPCGAPDALSWIGFGTFGRPTDANLFEILDAEKPADIWARRKNLSTSITLMSNTCAMKDRVYELFTAGGPLFLQLPEIYCWDDAYIQTAADLTEDYLSRDQRRPYRRWEAPVRTVGRPLGPTQGTACANWCAVNDAFPTYADMTASNGTWGDVAAGDLVCSNGAPVAPVTDSFTRSVVDGWGTTDTGQTWTNTGGTAADYDVTGTAGTHTHPVVNVTHNSMVPFPDTADVNVRVNASFQALPGADFVYAFVLARSADAQNWYAARFRVNPAGVMQLTIRRRVAGTETELVAAAVAGTYVAGVPYTIRLHVAGTALMAKAWASAGAEPAAWTVTTTDPTFINPDQVGVRSVVGAIVSPLPYVITFDNFSAVAG